MSPVLKCLLGLFIVLCFAQFIEMARIPRDNNAVNDFATKFGELGPNLSKIFQKEVSRFKETFETDEFKKFMASGTDQFNQFLENFKKTGDEVNKNKDIKTVNMGQNH
ncbi:uncharacterized protein LOC129248212 [Anastrepha obliqua]|uniref:uncharacterized protein LOC129248212 n=1 Tax=Anastrepha obliqua TaxID=95512 RepID=UPI002409DC9B|nr:uncharacterized protein LOC129248212 [Anastrepha obliqua]